jgi:hypothetical protein
MTIGAIGGYQSWWQWRNQPATNSDNSNNAITNTGSPAASANTSAFIQAFTGDLQSLLAQSGSNAATTDPTNQTATNQTNEVPRHHHHHHGGGEIGQSPQGGTLSSGQINQSASLFASDVFQALQAYGTATPMASSLLTV